MPAVQQKRRRNGKLQACEPCRKGKLACNHAIPHCGRCVRRQMTSKCFYHPAPMTGAAASKSPEDLLTPQPTPICETPIPSLSQGETAGDATSKRTDEIDSRLNHWSFIIRNATSLSTPYTIPCTARRAFNSGASLFKPVSGITSFSAVFSENKARFSGILDDERDGDGDIPADQSAIGIACIAQGIRVLTHFPKYDLCQRLLNISGAGDVDGPTLVRSILSHSVNSIWNTFDVCLAEPKDPEKLSLMADAIAKNQRRPLPPAPTDPTEWLSTFTGPNLRWEVLGLTFVYFGMAYRCLQDWDPIFRSQQNGDVPEDRRTISLRMLESASICLDLCNQTETANYIVAALTYNMFILESIVEGDESFQLWKRYGDMISLTFSLGLHRLPDPSTVPLKAELLWKIRIFAAIYGIDKCYCSFNGRPQSLDRHYCLRWVPLDLSGKQLLGHPEEIEAAVRNLDVNGWNTKGDINVMTQYRAYMYLQFIREEVLEVAMRVSVQSPKARLDDLRRRAHDTVTGFPAAVRPGLNDEDSYGEPGRVMWSRKCIGLEYYQNLFLIERIAVARCGADGQKLLDLALQMMEVLVSLWIKRDQLQQWNSCFEWQVVCYGIPSSGVLCLELLKPYRTKAVPVSSTANNNQPSAETSSQPLRFSRSLVIQNLTLFLNFLDWIRPTDGNYRLCRRMRKVIRRILDHVLEVPPLAAPVPPTAAIPDEATNPEFANGSKEDAMEDMTASGVVDNDIGGMNAGSGDWGASLGTPSLDSLDCLDWLNTVDWTQGFWMDLNNMGGNVGGVNNFPVNF